MIDVGGPQLFACDECPIICQLDYRLKIAEEHPEYGDFQFDYCGCDKVYDEFWQCGYCEDAWVDPPKQPKKGKHKTGRAYRRQMRVQKLNRQMNIAHHGGGNTMFMGFGLDKRGLPASNVWGLWMLGIDDDDVPRVYVKRPKSSKSRKFYKNHSNRILRRKCIVLPKGNQYHKYFEYWWTLL